MVDGEKLIPINIEDEIFQCSEWPELLTHNIFHLFWKVEMKIWKRATTFYGAEKSYTDLKCHHIKSISQNSRRKVKGRHYS